MQFIIVVSRGAYEVEDLGSRLVADVQQVAEAFRDDERHPLALALEQRVGGDRRSHANPLDLLRVDRLVSGKRLRCFLLIENFS